MPDGANDGAINSATTDTERAKTAAMIDTAEVQARTPAALLRAAVTAAANLAEHRAGRDRCGVDPTT